MVVLSITSEELLKQIAISLEFLNSVGLHRYLRIYILNKFPGHIDAASSQTLLESH